MMERQRIVDPRAEDRDIWGAGAGGPALVFQVMRSAVATECLGETSLREHRRPGGRTGFSSTSTTGGRRADPGEMVLADELPGPAALAKLLGDARPRAMHIPRQGSKARLVRLARERPQGDRGGARRRARGPGALGCGRVGLPAPLERIECFDVSSVMGAAVTASEVIFIDGGPDKAAYRRYRRTLANCPTTTR